MPSPHTIERQRGAKEASQQLAVLQEKWPLAFPVQHQDVRPLPLGTVGQIAEAMGWTIPYTIGVLTYWKMAPVYSDQALDAPLMNSISRALQRMLRQHEPFPAIVMDRHWNVLMTNDAAPRLFNCFIDLAARPSPRNLLHLMFNPLGMRPFVANWPQTARGLLGRVYREALGHVIDERTKRLLAELSQYPGVKPEWRAPSLGDAMPMIPLTFIKDDVTLNYFSMITTVGTPQTVTAQELRLECMFPADDATESRHSRFVEANSALRSSRH